MAGVFTAIGIFSSIMTKNQMVAGMLSFTLITLYISLMSISSKSNINNGNLEGNYQLLEQSLAPLTNGFEKLEQFSVGFIDVATIFHQIIFIMFFLVLSTIQLNRLNK